MKVFKLVSVLSLAVLATACGNGGTRANDVRTDGWNLRSSTGSTNPFQTASQNCSGTPNVTSQYQNLASYSACRENGQLKVYPSDNSNRSVCVFPVLVVNATAKAIRVSAYGPYINQYAVQCGQANQSGGTFNFGSLQFNGVYVVDSNFAGSFAQCIAYGDVNTCTQYANIPYAKGYIQ